jgi:hypothetical protein
MARLAASEQLLMRGEVTSHNPAAQRFSQRLGATLRPKVVALWASEAQRAILDD